MDKSRVGERGTSVLGALVLALMLGTGAVVTFELAGPSPASVSQTGASGVLAVDAPKTTPPKLKAEKCTNVYACHQVAVANSKEVLSQPCTPGFYYELTEKNGKIKITATAQNSGACPINKVSTTAKPPDDKAVAKEVTDAKLKLNKCSDDNLVRGHIKEGETGKCEYSYCTSLALTGSRLKGGMPSGTTKQKCSDGELSSGTLKDAIAQGRPDAIEKIVKDMDPKDIARIDAKEYTGLDRSRLEPLYEGLDERQKQIDDEVEKRETRWEQIEEIIKKCDSTAGCPGEDKDALKREQEALEKDNKKALEEIAKLDGLKKALADTASKGPPKGESEKEVVIKCVGTKCTYPDGRPAPVPGAGGYGSGGSNETFGKPGGGSGDLGQLLKGLTGQQNQPPPGNGVPRPAGTCNPSMICGNNTIYSRNNQCVDQAMQQCQYGCSGTQCSQPPPQGTGCLTAPSQPDPSGCQNGTFKPTYGGQNNACVVGWQCVPTGTGGGGTAPTAQLSCQPKVADVGMEALITFSCSAGTSSGSGFNTNGAQSGSATTTLSAPPGDTNTANFGLTCTNAGLTGSAQCSIQVGKPGIVLVANPKTVVSGKTSALGWVTSGMQKCIISSPNLPDLTSQNADKTSVNGTAHTPPLTETNSATTTYIFLLNCTTLGGGTRQASTTVSATP